LVVGCSVGAFFVYCLYVGLKLLIYF